MNGDCKINKQNLATKLDDDTGDLLVCACLFLQASEQARTQLVWIEILFR